MSDYATEGGHFYKKNGEPCYTYINSKGKESPTTLREAKKFDLVPSVTQIIGLYVKPALDIWKQDQTILACLTLPKVNGESEQDYIKRIKEDAKKQAKKAAERGTEIHGYIERGFRQELIKDEIGFDYFESVYNTIKNECGEQEWSTEKSFASLYGYGGKVDIHNDKYLIDFKGTDKEISTLKTWEDHAIQLSSYNMGLDLENADRQCGICYIHRETAESVLLWVDKKQLDKGWNCFLALLDFYYAKTGL